MKNKNKWRCYGYVKWFGGYNSNTGRENDFGFVCDITGEDVYLHKSNWVGNKNPTENDFVFYDVEEDNRKLKATNANLIDDEPLTLIELNEVILAFTDSGAPMLERGSLKASIGTSFGRSFLNAAPDQRKLFLENNPTDHIWKILSDRGVSSEVIDEIMRMESINPLKYIPAHHINAKYFIDNEEDSFKHLLDLDTELARDMTVKRYATFRQMPISLVCYLVVDDIVYSEEELGSRLHELNGYIGSMISDGVNNYPSYLDEFIQSKIKVKGDLRTHHIIGEIIDVALFKKYLSEKNFKFEALYKNSIHLQNRIDIFILYNIFSLILAGNKIELAYEIFLTRLWSAITKKSLDPTAQKEELDSIFPSCRTIVSVKNSGALFCEAVYWKKQNKFLCRGRECRDTQVIPDLTKKYLDFTIYDWFSYYEIDYLNEREPSSRDFPIKLAGYLNRILEIYEVIHCRCCRSLMIPDMRYSRVEYTDIENGQFIKRDMAATYRVTVFKCPNNSCQEYDKGCYINHCISFGCYMIIDARDLQIKCDGGLFVCKGCGGCCGVHLKSNPVGLCPDCGSSLTLYEDINDITQNDKNRFVKCSSKTCKFTISNNRLAKKFYLDSCGPTIKVKLPT